MVRTDLPPMEAHSTAISSAAIHGDGEQMDYVLEAEKVTKVFQRRGRPPLVALSEVSVAVRPGEFVCLIGPSGCGKSTLLSLLSGLTEPSAGRILFRGSPVSGTDPQRGMLFQQPSLFPWLTIRQNIMFGPKAQRRSRPEAAAQTEHLLQKVGLADFGEAYPRELSGGMKHRAAFARALINEPSVLFLDEPFAALDAITRASMQQLLIEIWAESNMSIVFVTHDVGEAALLGDRVVLMSPRPGRIHQIVPNPVLRPARLDVDSPASAELRRTLRGELAHIMATDPGRVGHA